MGEGIEWCPFAVLCRVPENARSSAPPVLQSARELLVAIAHRQLQIFVRRSDRVPSSCACDATALQKHGFLCPHITSYEDYAHTLTIPTGAIAQVLMTYRTTAVVAANANANAKTVATRTKDLVLTVETAPSSALLVWLEFEHNLARGWFLESLMAATTSPQMDVDYLDLSDALAVELLQKSVCNKLQSSTAFAPRSPISRTVSPTVVGANALALFLRDAWRHVVYDKVKLTLQISHDNPASVDGSDDDPVVAGLLTTAMELSMRLDEPDLDAFTWLASGFLNMQSHSPAKEALALAQIQHSLRLARENSMMYLSCLALQCAGDYYSVHGREDTSQARDMVTQAAKLLTISDQCSAMEPPLKMRLHAMLQQLNANATTKPGDERPSLPRAHSTLARPAELEPRRDQFAVAPRSGSSSSLLSKASKAKVLSFSLGAHVFGSGFTSSSSMNINTGTTTRRASASDEVHGDAIKKLLLQRVTKCHGTNGGSGGSCFVDVLGPHGARKARFRVFYTPQNSFLWLQDHIRQRYDVVRRCNEPESDPHTLDFAEPVHVELFYDPQRKQLVSSLASTRLSEWIPAATAPTAAFLYEFHAKLSLRVQSSHRSCGGSGSSASSLRGADSMPALVTAIPTQGTAPSGDCTTSSVLCSLCGRRIGLDVVEEHSETCF